jgi:hypothetical protein
MASTLLRQRVDPGHAEVSVMAGLGAACADSGLVSAVDQLHVSRSDGTGFLSSPHTARPALDWRRAAE